MILVILLYPFPQGGENGSASRRAGFKTDHVCIVFSTVLPACLVLSKQQIVVRIVSSLPIVAVSPKPWAFPTSPTCHPGLPVCPQPEDSASSPILSCSHHQAVCLRSVFPSFHPLPAPCHSTLPTAHLFPLLESLLQPQKNSSPQLALILSRSRCHRRQRRMRHQPDWRHHCPGERSRADKAPNVDPKSLLPLPKPAPR